jgi:hypothetical protein
MKRSKWLDVWFLAIGMFVVLFSLNPWYRLDYWWVLTIVGFVVAYIGKFLMQSQSSESKQEK